MLAPVRSQSKPSTEAFTAKNFITDNQYLSILQGIITTQGNFFSPCFLKEFGHCRFSFNTFSGRAFSSSESLNSIFTAIFLAWKEAI